jgi:hypothetical protein
MFPQFFAFGAFIAEQNQKRQPKQVVPDKPISQPVD